MKTINARDPNISPDNAMLCAGNGRIEILQNPALPLLFLEDPTLKEDIFAGLRSYLRPQALKRSKFLNMRYPHILIGYLGEDLADSWWGEVGRNGQLDFWADQLQEKGAKVAEEIRLPDYDIDFCRSVWRAVFGGSISDLSYAEIQKRAKAKILELLQEFFDLSSYKEGKGYAI